MTDDLPSVFPVVQDDDSKDLKSDRVGSVTKEQMEFAPMTSHESVPVVELREDERVPESVENWMEKLEQGEEIKLPQPVTDDDQVLVDNSSDDISEDKLILPMTENQVSEGLHKKVYNSARWLAEWCIRVAKKLQGQVVYRMQAEQGNK